MNIFLKNRAARVVEGSIEINTWKLGDKTYSVRAYERGTDMGFIIHATDASEAIEEAKILITSSEDIYFTAIIHKLETTKPRDISPSQYIKPSDFGVVL